MVNDYLIENLKVYIKCEEYDSVICPSCEGLTKPIGLGSKNNGKIQLVRRCRSCYKVYWFWIDIEMAHIPFGE